MYTNYYANAFSRSALATQPMRLNFPSDLSLLNSAQKFRVNATLALTALTLGHLSQGHMLMEQAKQYLPEALSSCTLDAAIGFNSLAMCHTMEFDFMPSANYLKLSKSVASTLWKMLRKNITHLQQIGGLAIQAGFQSLMLKILALHQELYFSDSIKVLQRKVDNLQSISDKWNVEMPQILNVVKSLYRLYLGDVDNLMETLQMIEISVTDFSLIWKDGGASILLPMIRSLKYSLLGQPGATRAECQSVIRWFDQTLTLTPSTLQLLNSICMLWSALGLQDELRQILVIADRMSVFFPGCKCIVERFRNPQLNGENDQFNSWNPFVTLINNCNMRNMPTSNNTNTATQQIQTMHPFMMGEAEGVPSPSFSSSDSNYSPDGNLQFNPEEFMFDDLKSSIDMF
jgi:hypothetical protein